MIVKRAQRWSKFLYSSPQILPSLLYIRLSSCNSLNSDIIPDTSFLVPRHYFQLVGRKVFLQPALFVQVACLCAYVTAKRVTTYRTLFSDLLIVAKACARGRFLFRCEVMCPLTSSSLQNTLHSLILHRKESFVAYRIDIYILDSTKDASNHWFLPNLNLCVITWPHSLITSLPSEVNKQTRHHPPFSFNFA